jgi:hypothetical protein
MADIIVPAPAQMSNSGYDNIPVGGSIQNTTAYRDVRQMNIYEFMEATYTGEDGYRDCSYLTPTARETFYEDRRRVSYYVNAFKPILNAMVDECFNKPATRTTNNNLFQSFIENCDAAGTPLGTFMQSAIKNARLYSINFIVMENFKPEELQTTDTIEQAANQRLYPYIYEKEPCDVYKTETNKQGALEAITFCDEEIEIGGKKVETYRRWDDNTWETFYLKYSDGEEIKVPLESGVHGLGMLPVVAIIDFARTASLKELPEPELYDIAFLCFGLFNKESQVCWMEIMQTFAILCTSGMGNNAKAIGPGTFLDSGTDSKYPPQYVSPAQDGIRTLIDNCQRLKEEIQNQAKQKGVIGIKEAESGIAKEWDFRAEEAVLCQTANACERVELALSVIFGAYINSAVSYTVDYPKEYSPLADGNRINTLLTLLKEAPPKPVETATWKEIAGIVWKGNEEKIAEIEAQIDTAEAENVVINDMRTRETVPPETLPNE